MPENIIETRGIGKEFNGVWVLRDIDFTLRKGEIHALIGENGAGKSTFIKILSGVYSKSSGQIWMEGEERNFANAEQSEQAGIRTVHQEIQLVPTFKVYENVYIGTEAYKSVAGVKVMRDSDMRKRTREVLDSLNCKVSENAVTMYLNTSLKKIVEISKVLLYEPKVIIFDEPTTALGETEREILLNTIVGLKDHGVSIIYISHNLEEVKRIADRTTVFRDGLKVAEFEKEEIEIESIINAMLGSKSYDSYKRTIKNVQDEVVLEAKNLTSSKLKDISFSLKKGEILGVAGVVGAGKTELAKALFGLDRITGGSFVYKGKEVKKQTVAAAIKSGMALVPEERQAEGIIPSFSVTRNTTLTYMDKWSPHGVLDFKAEEAHTKEYIDKLSIKTTGPQQAMRNLSGGNQQKVILSRWLSGDFDLGIFDDPTKGIDIKAREDIYKLMEQLAAEGKSIIITSSYLPELLATCDRIIVLHEGEMVGEYRPDEENAESKITTVMLGGQA